MLPWHVMLHVIPSSLSQWNTHNMVNAHNAHMLSSPYSDTRGVVCNQIAIVIHTRLN